MSTSRYEKEKESIAAYYRENRDAILAYNKRYRSKYAPELARKASERSKAYQKRNKDNPEYRARISANSLRCRENQKRIVVSHYSKGTMGCALCPESRMPCLTIDHIYGGGNAHRKQIGGHRGSNGFYQWLRKNGFPEGFRVLCMNCQFMSLHYQRKGAKIEL